MALQELVCKTCNGKIIYDPDSKKGRCLFCGVEYLDEVVNNTINNTFTGDINYNGTVVQNITMNHNSYDETCKKLLEAGLLNDLRNTAVQYIEECPADFWAYYYWLAACSSDYSGQMMDFEMKHFYEKAIRLSKNCSNQEAVNRMIQWEKDCAQYAYEETGVPIKPEFLKRYREDTRLYFVHAVNKKENMIKTIVFAVIGALLTLTIVTAEEPSIGALITVLGIFGYLSSKYFIKMKKCHEQEREYCRRIGDIPRYDK